MVGRGSATAEAHSIRHRSQQISCQPQVMAGELECFRWRGVRLGRCRAEQQGHVPVQVLGEVVSDLCVQVQCRLEDPRHSAAFEGVLERERRVSRPLARVRRSFNRLSPLDEAALFADVNLLALGR